MALCVDPFICVVLLNVWRRSHAVGFASLRACSYEVGTVYNSPFDFDGARCLSSIVVLYTPAFLYIFTVRILTSPLAWWMARRGTPWLLAGTSPPMQLAGTFLSDRVWLLACFGLFQNRRLENPYANLFKPVSQEALEVCRRMHPHRTRGLWVGFLLSGGLSCRGWAPHAVGSRLPAACSVYRCTAPRRLTRGRLSVVPSDSPWFGPNHRYSTRPSPACWRLTSSRLRRARGCFPLWWRLLHWDASSPSSASTQPSEKSVPVVSSARIFFRIVFSRSLAPLPSLQSDRMSRNAHVPFFSHAYFCSFSCPFPFPRPIIAQSSRTFQIFALLNLPFFQPIFLTLFLSPFRTGSSFGPLLTETRAGGLQKAGYCRLFLTCLSLQGPACPERPNHALPMVCVIMLMVFHSCYLVVILVAANFEIVGLSPQRPFRA